MQRLLKRQIDFWGALLGLIILAIPFTVVALAIKLDSKGPVFFRQERVGIDGQSFRVWKFRTMIAASPFRHGIQRHWQKRLLSYLGCLKRSGKRWASAGGST